MPDEEHDPSTSPQGGIEDLTNGVLSRALLGIGELTERSYAKVEQELRNAHAVGKMTVTFGAAELTRRAKSLTKSSTKAERPESSRTHTGGSNPTPSTQNHGAIDDLIPGYDDLSASQVIKLLGDVSAADLPRIGAHETAGRSRRTILNRIEQLTARTQ